MRVRFGEHASAETAAGRSTSGTGSGTGAGTPTRTRPHRRVGPARKRGSRDRLTRSQAERELRRLTDAEELVRSRERARPTVAKLGDVHETRLQSLGRKRSPIEAVESHVRVYIAPWFGDLGVDELDEGKVEAFVAWLGRKACSPKGGLMTPPKRPDRDHDAGHDRGR